MHGTGKNPDTSAAMLPPIAAFTENCARLATVDVGQGFPVDIVPYG
jgi:hypothetical protein